MGRKRENGTLIDYVVEKIIKEEYVSTPFIQRNFNVSYVKAQEILKQLAKMKYIEEVVEHKQLKVIRHKYFE